MFWGGYTKELKVEGRMDTTHNDEIPADSLEKIQEHLVLLQSIMRCDKAQDKVKYKSLIQKLPTEYQQDYHRLFQYAAFFIIAMHFARRGREGNNFNNFKNIFPPQKN